MTNIVTISNSPTDHSQTENRKGEKFALLARVGAQGRKASQFRDEAIFYCGIVTELLALFTEVVTFLQRAEKHTPQLAPFVAVITSRQHHLVKRILGHWPTNSESRLRAQTLLESDGLGPLLGSTEDGYVSLSSDLILENVERIIVATRMRNQKPSSE